MPPKNKTLVSMPFLQIFNFQEMESHAQFGLSKGFEPK